MPAMKASIASRDSSWPSRFKPMMSTALTGDSRSAFDGASQRTVRRPLIRWSPIGDVAGPERSGGCRFAHFRERVLRHLVARGSRSPQDPAGSGASPPTLARIASSDAGPSRETNPSSEASATTERGSISYALMRQSTIRSVETARTKHRHGAGASRVPGGTRIHRITTR
jgi:hypothetical protein